VWVLQNSDAPLVGRERELGLLVDSFDEAQADSRCRLATVLGAAGMGKSRLVHELVRAVEPATLRSGRAPFSWAYRGRLPVPSRASSLRRPEMCYRCYSEDLRKDCRPGV
jgi:hypothetical protein